MHRHTQIHRQTDIYTIYRCQFTYLHVFGLLEGILKTTRTAEEGHTWGGGGIKAPNPAGMRLPTEPECNSQNTFINSMFYCP